MARIDGRAVLLGAAAIIAVAIIAMMVFGVYPVLVEMNAYMALG